MGIRRIRVLSAGVLALTALATAAQGPGPRAGDVVVPVQEVVRPATVALGGTVVPYKEVTLAAQLPGRVVFLAGEEGDGFDKGARLARLDDKELRGRWQAAQAALRDADVALHNAGVQYNLELYSPQRSSPGQFGGMGMPSLMDQFITRPMGSMMGQSSPYVERHADLYGRGTQIEQAKNARSRAEAELRQLRAKFRDIESIAPFDGVITKKFVEEGDPVQPGQPLLEFADTAYLQVQVEVPARLMTHRVQKGMEARARLDVGDWEGPVRVAQIFPIADPERHTVRVKFDLHPEAPGGAGMYAEVMFPDIRAGARQVLVIPTAAIVQRGSLPMVEIEMGEGQRQLKIVRLGECYGPDHKTVLSGLRPGDTVYVNPERDDRRCQGGGRQPPVPGPQRGPVTVPRY